MTTKTVELPLTKSEQRHLDNIRRRDAKRASTNARLLSVAERDAKLKKINDHFAPRIADLQEQRAKELREVWSDWRKRRETETRSEAAA